MRRTEILLLAFVSVFACTLCQATFVHYCNPLLGGSASVFGQDGNLWIGVPGIGLVGLDAASGLTCAYGLKHGLRKNDVFYEASQDPAGRIWLSQPNLISCFENGQFTCYGKESGIYNNMPPLSCAPDGSVWTASIDGGLRRFDGEAWVEVNNAPIDSAVLIKFSPDGTGWFLKWGGPLTFAHLVSYKEGAWTVFDEFPEVQDSLKFMAVTSSGDVWIVTLNSVIRCREGNFDRTFTSADGLAGYDVSEIAEDLRGNVWVGDLRAGASMFDGTQWTVFNTLNSGLISNCVKSVSAGLDGSVYFATELGVCRYNSGLWSEYRGQGIPSNKVHSVAINEQGDVYFGTYSGELGHFDGSEWEVLHDFAPGESARQINDIAFDRRGALWLAGQDEVTVWLGTATRHAWAGEMSLVESKRIARDGDGAMWVCAGLGLARYDFSSWQPFRTVEGNYPRYHPLQPQSIVCDLNGDIWVGTAEAGLAKLRGDAIVGFFPEYPGVTAMTCDNDGVLWLGFDGRGVLEFDGENELAWHTVDSGLPSNEINCIDCDASNNIWLGTDEGIGFFDRQAWSKHDLETGLEVKEIRDVYCSPVGGDVWFATPAGLLQHKSEMLPPRPSIQITTDAELYHAGDTMAVALSYENPGLSLLVDIQIACQLPDGSLYYYPGGDVPVPYTSGELPSGTKVLPFVAVSYTFGADFPAGNYTWLAGLFQQGSFDMIGELSAAPWRFE